MKKIGMKAWFVGVALVAFGVAASASYARSTSAIDGDALFASDKQFFGNGFFNPGTITNTSGQTRTWCIPLPVDSSGSKHVSVTAEAPSGSNVSCTARGLDRNGTQNGGSETRSLNQFGSFTQIDPLDVSIFPFGALVVCCNIGPNAAVSSVDYNP